jgi:uncharacterized linocin/CFP29 family protein
MSHLLREHAPISDRGWELIEDEAKRQLTVAMAARRLVDFKGPHGWQRAAVGTGRAEAVGDGPVDGVSAVRRRVLALVEPRVAFGVARAELEDIDRGAEDPDLDAVGEAARRLALTENVAVFRGWPEAGIAGLAESSPHAARQLEEDMTACPRHVAEAVQILREHGVDGPFGLALSPDIHRRVVETTEHGGYPLFEHLRNILGGPLVWAPGVEGGVVVSLRGDDFRLHVGQDAAIGYSSHDDEAVQLYLVESFTFQVLTPEAAVVLRNARQ